MANETERNNSVWQAMLDSFSEGLTPEQMGVLYDDIIMIELFFHALARARHKLTTFRTKYFKRVL